MIPRRFVVRVVKHIVCFITLAQALDSLLICCPGCRTFVASFVNFCLYIFIVLTRIKLVAFLICLTFLMERSSKWGLLSAPNFVRLILIWFLLNSFFYYFCGYSFYHYYYYYYY